MHKASAGQQTLEALCWYESPAHAQAAQWGCCATAALKLCWQLKRLILPRLMFECTGLCCGRVLRKCFGSSIFVTYMHMHACKQCICVLLRRKACVNFGIPHGVCMQCKMHICCLVHTHVYQRNICELVWFNEQCR